MNPNDPPDATPGPASLPVPARHPMPAVVAAGPSILAAPPDPIALLRALRRRWPSAVAVGLLAAAAAGWVAYLLVPPAKYTARAMLHVNSSPPRIILQVKELSSDFASYQRTQLALLKSRLVLNTALKQEGIDKLAAVATQADPAEWLDKELQVDFPNGSEILRITMSGQEPETPMKLVNAVTQAYLDGVVMAETRQRQERKELLKQTWDHYQQDLRTRRKELKSLTASTGSDDKKTLAAIHQHELDRLQRTEEELARVRTDLRNLQIEQEVEGDRSQGAGATVTRAMVEEQVDSDRSIELLAARVAEAQKAYEGAARVVRDQADPSLQRCRAAVQSARSALEAQRKKLYPIVARQMEEALRGEAESRASSLPRRIEILAKVEATLAGEVARLTERSRTITRDSLDLFSIQEEIATAEEITRTIGAEVEALSLELQAPPRVRLLEKAELPRTKDESRPLKMAGMTGFGVFALVLVGFSFLEFRARRVGSVSDVVLGLGLGLVGTLPILPSRGGMRRRGWGRARARSERWESMMTESVDAARTALLHASRVGSIRVVMIASALSGEGKTSLSSHLALSLTRAGRRTALVDGDLRRPSAHRLFDLPLGPGLCEVLRGEADILGVLRPTAAAGLSMITAGACDGRAIQALAYKDIRGLFDQLLEEFDFIVVDSSPILPVADALLLGQHADAAIFSIMRDVSRLPTVHAARERMANLGIRMLGAVVAGSDINPYGGDYQYYADPPGRE